jgi:hypothetical protein
LEYEKLAALHIHFQKINSRRRGNVVKALGLDVISVNDTEKRRQVVKFFKQREIGFIKR